MKALVGAFNQEKALIGAFSVIVKTEGSVAALLIVVSYYLLIVDRNDCRRSSSNLSTKKRPSWCQDLPSSSLPLASSLAGPGGGAGGGTGGGVGEGWSPRGRSIDLRACGAIKSLGKVEEGAEVVALNL